MANNIERLPKVMLREVELYWTWLAEPRQQQDGKYKYESELCNLSKEQAKALHEIGLKVHKGKDLKKPQPEKGNFLKVKTQVQPKVLDEHAEEMKADDIPRIGNGTKASVLITPFNHEMNGGGTSSWLEKVQILELVPLGLGSEEEDDPDLQFKAEDKYIKEKKAVEVVGDDGDPDWD